MAQSVVYADINLTGGQKTENRQRRSAKEGKRRCWITCGVVVCFLVASGITIIIMAIKVSEGDHTQQTESNKSYKCCPDLWIKRRKNCYYFSVNKTTWERSSWQCKSHGSQLAAAEDEEELDFLIDYCRSYSTFWIGLKRNSKDGWTWIDEQFFNLNWKTQVKEDGGDCAFVRKQSVQSKTCSTDLHWICKKPLEH
ncbi:killer cell lectin-like receptor subfamily B member 1B allele A isoform X2 [Polypterus senegalus]|uniref:killer cell lectin-like receptor subfamily B member 1B allele A isoform X2 n=1 Tax=Polypterus senegalus TaxID=55291 RepID=UPI001965FD2F|nr:killer cell lectin-like receptor subfamily B member 1B allele A isoform X2 [Polypterus senegalus]